MNRPSVHLSDLTREQFTNPQPRVKGLWIPQATLDAAQAGTISVLEGLLVAVVDWYVSIEHKGCWATNKTLAKWVGVTDRHVKRMMTKLTRLGFVIRGPDIVTPHGKGRMIWSYYSTIKAPTAEGQAGGWGHPGPHPWGHPGPPIVIGNKTKGNAVAADAADRNPGNLPVNTKVQEATLPPLTELFSSALTKPSKDKSKLEPVDLQAADFVRKLCVEQQWVIGRTHKKWWADSIRKLRQSENGPTPEQVTTTLAAYAAAVKAGKTKFTITDCDQVRKNWPRLQSIASKVPVPASPRAQEVARKVSLQAKWPKVTPADVAGFAQRCISFGEDLCRRLSAVKKKLEDKKPKTTADRVLMGAAQALHVRVANPDSWTMTYMAKVLKEVRAWKDWSGDLSMYLPSLTSGKAGLRKAVLAAGCDEPTWTLLKEALK